MTVASIKPALLFNLLIISWLGWVGVGKASQNIYRCYDPEISDDDWDPMTSRVAPESLVYRGGTPQNYSIKPARLAHIRKELLYPFFDRGNCGDNSGDYHEHAREDNPPLTKRLNFYLPFFGFAYNYTWLSINGHLAFSQGPNWTESQTLEFPVRDYPNVPDPSFIGPLYSLCKIGEMGVDELDPRRPGVYFRVLRELTSRRDQFGVEIRERLKWDIREGIVGAERFEPTSAVIVTWKNVTFAGETNETSKTTNTFQLVLASDEVRTYAIFNYQHLGWTTNTVVGGSSEDGTRRTPAFVGFNAGNGTRSYEYKPYSQNVHQITNLLSGGNVNGHPGRHIFRVDEKIMPGQCTPELGAAIANQQQILTFAPESGNMLGGTLVNVTGPCFQPNQNITCRFDNTTVNGTVMDRHRASCIMARLNVTGYTDLNLEVEGNNVTWIGKYFVESPSASPQHVYFPKNEHLEVAPVNLTIRWDYGNLTDNKNSQVSIKLWGYTENAMDSDIAYMTTLADGVPNSGQYVIKLEDIRNGTDGRMLQFQVGLISISLTSAGASLTHLHGPILWSKPFPLSWYLSPSWTNEYGQAWKEGMCRNWTIRDKTLKDFSDELPLCPCNLDQALADKGRFLPDPDCDKDAKVSDCNFHQNAKHCVRSAMPSNSGAGQQCCYDMHGYLMMTMDNMWGGHPTRYHNLAGTPTLSQYLHDLFPVFPCCLWREWGERNNWGCRMYRFKRRASQDCVGYQPPVVVTVFGNSHVYTFDGHLYIFGGKGEFVLVSSKTDTHPELDLDVQGRFEERPIYRFGELKTTVSTLTAVAARAGNSTPTVEVRLRPEDARRRYKLDVIVDSHRIYFDRYPQKVQTFPGVTVYSPTPIQNQSQVIIMFESGAGVEVIENRGHLAARVYLPRTYLNQTRGRFGNFSGSTDDDFVSPDGSMFTPKFNSDPEAVYEKFALNWIVRNANGSDTNSTSVSIFQYENGRNSSTFNDINFRPNYKPPIPNNSNKYEYERNRRLKTYYEDIKGFCGSSLPCIYDYTLTLDREDGFWAKHFQGEYLTLKGKGLNSIVSCGYLETPLHGRKSTFKYTVGTKVALDCDPNFILVGPRMYECSGEGKWEQAKSPWFGVRYAQDEKTLCIAEDEYQARWVSGV